MKTTQQVDKWLIPLMDSLVSVGVNRLNKELPVGFDNKCQFSISLIPVYDLLYTLFTYRCSNLAIVYSFQIWARLVGPTSDECSVHAGSAIRDQERPNSR